MSVLLDALKKAALEKQKRNAEAGEAKNDPAQDGELKVIANPTSTPASVKHDAVDEKIHAHVEVTGDELSPEFKAVESENSHSDSTFISDDVDYSHDKNTASSSAELPHGMASTVSEVELYTPEEDQPLEILVDIDPELLEEHHEDEYIHQELHGIKDDDLEAEHALNKEEQLDMQSMSEEELIGLQMQMLEQEKQQLSDVTKQQVSSVEVQANNLEQDVGSTLHKQPASSSQQMSDDELKQLLSNVAIDDSLVSQIKQDSSGVEDQRKVSFRLLLDKNKKEQYKRRLTFLILFLIVIFVAVAVIAGYYFYVKSEEGNIHNLSSRQFIDVGESLPAHGNSEIAEAEAIEAQVQNAQGQADSEVNLKAETEITRPSVASGDTVSEDKLKSGTVSTGNATEHQSHTNKNQAEISSSIVPDRWAQETSRDARIIPNNNIITLGKSKAPPVTEYVERGYNAYQQGSFEFARRQYENALALDPYHRDALLGAAAVAAAQERYVTAMHYYQTQLSRQPHDDYAHAGLLAIALREGATPEILSKVNTLLKDNPKAAHLHFLRGTLYAKQQHWPAAQAAFFSAWSLESERADYTYNLAISLDHLRQYKEALRFYRLTLQLTNLNISTEQIQRLQKRIAQLEVLYE